jgi:predicted Fe-Mo cluster-binding NifX family protein
MKVAISSSGEKLADNVSEVFARCPYFVIAEIEDKKIQKTEVIENKIADQLGQAGISAAQLMAEKDAKVVITRNVGPRALNVLNQFQIGVYIGEGSVEKVLQEFIDGKLKKTN